MGKRVGVGFWVMDSVSATRDVTWWALSWRHFHPLLCILCVEQCILSEWSVSQSVLCWREGKGGASGPEKRWFCVTSHVMLGDWVRSGRGWSRESELPERSGKDLKGGRKAWDWCRDSSGDGIGRPHRMVGCRGSEDRSWVNPCDSVDVGGKITRLRCAGEGRARIRWNEGKVMNFVWVTEWHPDADIQWAIGYMWFCLKRYIWASVASNW